MSLFVEILSLLLLDVRVMLSIIIIIYHMQKYPKSENMKLKLVCPGIAYYSNTSVNLFRKTNFYRKVIRTL